MKNYFKILFDGKKRREYAEECRAGNFIGVDCEVDTDLNSYLSDDLEDFKNKFIPLYLKSHQVKDREAGKIAELFWTYFIKMKKGDIVVCPNGNGTLYFGLVTGDYYYDPESILQHRRPLNWISSFRRDPISKEFNQSLYATSPSLVITQHGEEIEKYIRKGKPPQPPSRPTVMVTAEKLLENFLVENWEHTELGRVYDIFEKDGELVGQQYETDTGPIDILAISKDKKEWLIVELKRGRASDVVVGQIQRYMGFVKNNFAEKDQLVKGIIIGAEDSLGIRNALEVTQNIQFYSYRVDIQFIK